MPSTKSKKAKARRSREADIMSVRENMDVMLGSGGDNGIESDIDQMTGFSNMLNRDDIEEGHSMSRNSSQDNEIQKMPEKRSDPSLTRDLDMFSSKMNLGISQEINSLLNGVNSQIENAISSAISERVIPQMQGAVEGILNRQLESVSSISRRPQNKGSDACNGDENNLQYGNSRSRQNLMEPDPDDESLHPHPTFEVS